jgi:hypothetical protein
MNKDDEAFNMARELVFGRWKSQILYAGVKLDVFEAVDAASATSAVSADDVATKCQLDEAHTYRLMRALACMGLLKEHDDKAFSLTPAGSAFTARHPRSLRGLTLFEEGPQHYALWKHLPDMIKDGKQNAFTREFGHHAFEETKKDPDGYGALFDNAMSSFSLSQTTSMLDAMATDESGFLQGCKSVCDVGGGRGHMLCSIVKKYPNVERGVVLEIPAVTNGLDHPVWAADLGVEDRVSYRTGSMFDASSIPSEGVYFMKMILHDWNDDECVQILTNCLDKAPKGAHMCIVEHIVPGPDTPHFAKLFDIHMMCWGTGRERTEEEYVGLLTKAGWKFVKALYPQDRAMGVVIGLKDM